MAYGVTVVIGRTLARDGLNAASALGVRFSLGALILLGVQAVRGAALVPVRREWLAVFLLGAIGYALESTCFYAALGRGTAAAVGLLFYSYPVIVTTLELATGTVRLSARVVVALVLAGLGVAVVIVAGESVSITTAGVVLALLSSLTFSLYFVASHRLVIETDPITNAAWISFGAAVSIGGRGILTGSIHIPPGHTLDLLAYGIANALAFGFMFAALRRLGPTRTSVILTFEVFATVLLAAVFLDETLKPVQALGGVAIAAGAVLVTLATPAPAPAPARAIDFEMEPPP